MKLAFNEENLLTGISDHILLADSISTKSCCTLSRSALIEKLAIYSLGNALETLVCPKENK
ncbi:MAG: hypothetical protein WCG25_09170 [bacterium]